MAAEWEVVSLDRLIDADRGISYGIVQPGAPVDAGIPIVRVSDIRNGRIATTDPLKVSPEIEAAYSRTRLKGGELLLTLVGTVGEAAIVPSSLAGWNTARAVAVIPVRKEIGSYWVQLALRSPAVKEQIGSRVNTTVQTTLNLRDVSQLPIVLPPAGQRQAIAHILGTLDDKIELSMRMNETLEAMARALFKSWFIDFDSVRAKLDGKDSGLRQPLADVFPDQLVDSELGELPGGWKIGRFNDVVEQFREHENPMESPDALFHHFSIPAFDEGQSPKIELGEKIKSLKSRVPSGAILLSKLNPEIERVWLVDVDTIDRAVCSTEFLVLRPRPPYNLPYAYCLTRSPFFRQQIESLVTGTSKSHQRAQVDVIKGLQVILPPKPVADAFAKIATPFLERTLVCRRESRILTSLRDTLLPKLISGELRVKDAEKQMEAVA